MSRFQIFIKLTGTATQAPAQCKTPTRIASAAFGRAERAPPLRERSNTPSILHAGMAGLAATGDTTVGAINSLPCVPTFHRQPAGERNRRAQRRRLRPLITPMVSCPCADYASRCRAAYAARAPPAKPDFEPHS